jgi:anaerobic magnesium-protoporphyrin IX monomethyl ester cyclase
LKLILIYPDILKGAGWSGYFYTGVGYLSASAKSAGHNVSLIHVTHMPREHDFIQMVDDELASSRDALIAFSATTNMFPFVRSWSAWIRDRYANTILVGGVHPTLNPDETICVESIDAICIGEGEGPLVEVLEALQRGGDISGIPNIWTKNDGEVCRNPVRHVIKDLDTLPFPDRRIFDYRNLDREKEGIGVFMASRGCPYNCYYCCNHAIRDCLGSTSDYTRFRSVGNVIREIKQVVAEYPFIKFLHFDDDILPINKKWFREFAESYSQEIALPFECNMRPNLIDEATIELLQKAGCRTLRLGLESGNEYIRNEILNRGLSEDTIVKASALCRKAGIRLYTFNMVGLPSEDMSARLDTVRLNAKINSDEEQVSIFYPYEKTRLFDICREHGLIRDHDVSDPFRDTSLSFDQVSKNQIVFTAYYFTVLVRFYKLLMKMPPYLSRTMDRISQGILSSRVTAMALYPPMIVLLRFLKRHEALENMARKVKHAILGKEKVSK